MTYFAKPIQDVSAETEKMFKKIEGKISRRDARSHDQAFVATLDQEISDLIQKIQTLDPNFFSSRGIAITTPPSEEVDEPFERVHRDADRYDEQIVAAMDISQIPAAYQQKIAAILAQYRSKGELSIGGRLHLVRTLAIQFNAVNNAKSASLEEQLLGLIEEGILTPTKTAPFQLNAKTVSQMTSIEDLTLALQSDNKDILQAVYNHPLIKTNYDLFLMVDAKLEALKGNEQ
jgi:hypothetical protein